MTRALILTGGIGHPFADASQALAAILAEAGFESTITEDIEAGAADLAEGGFGLLVVYALRWRMLIGEKYAPHRAQWGYSPTVPQFVAAGGGLLALHTAVICFDDWPAWGDLVGGSWVWGHSSHPPLGGITVSPSDIAHPITDGTKPFALKDEVYGGLNLLPGIVPLASANGGAGSQPVLWAQDPGMGRIVTDLLGHDRAALEHPSHRRIIARAASWATRRLPS
jgi:uncharacterized protein